VAFVHNQSSKPGVTIPKITVTKLDAGRGQLRAAIRLWFDGGDPTAIHTLAAAAHEIIHALFRRKGLRGLMFDSDLMKPDARQKIARDLKRPANFFKHAKDPNETEFTFDPHWTELFMLTCCKGLREMGEVLGPEETALIYWFLFTRPDALPHPGIAKSPQIKAVEQMVTHGPSVFFREFREAWRLGRVTSL
jgi:hypothetical protein